MKYNQARKLRPGMTVYWRDPDANCSRRYKIATVKVVGGIVKIADPQGDHLECCAGELKLIRKTNPKPIIRTITVYRLDLQFDADQITHGPASAQADRAIELINLTLQREPFGLGAQLFAHRDEIEIETYNQPTN